MIKMYFLAQEKDNLIDFNFVKFHHCSLKTFYAIEENVLGCFFLANSVYLIFSRHAFQRKDNRFDKFTQVY